MASAGRPKGIVFEALVLRGARVSPRWPQMYEGGSQSSADPKMLDGRSGGNQVPASGPDDLPEGWSGAQTAPGVRGILRRLTQKGFRLGVVGTAEAAAGAGAGYSDVELGRVLEVMGLDGREVLLVAAAGGEKHERVLDGMSVVWVMTEGETVVTEKQDEDEDVAVGEDEEEDGESSSGGGPAQRTSKSNGSGPEENWSPLKEHFTHGSSSHDSLHDNPDPDGKWSRLGPARDGDRTPAKKPDPDGNWSPLGEDLKNGKETSHDTPHKESDLAGNWSPLEEPPKNGRRTPRVKPDPDGSWSPLEEPPKNGHRTSPSAPHDESGLAGNWSPLEDPPENGNTTSRDAPYRKSGPDGSWSPLKEAAKNGSRTAPTAPHNPNPDGNWSPLEDPPKKGNRPSSYENPTDKSGLAGNWSPMEDPPKNRNRTSPNAPHDPNLDGNWSPLEDPPKNGNRTPHGRREPKAATLDEALADFL
ncbi:hypothetical protein E4U43_002489 [Claviceps pusilla]|uniref:Uncharacterized protein n=1 Tax=Claviceps pusilla TaxID=123648 RepID=A0A9P7N690_9HYPO|nr:hypothetical protein E4U43_002489 [Claviceps pusilla]